MIMTSMTLDLPRRFPWPTLLSVCIHGAVVAGAGSTLVHHCILLSTPPPPLSASSVVPPGPGSTPTLTTRP
ncbi:TonB system transport protein TonB, partial [Escherichia coli]